MGHWVLRRRRAKWELSESGCGETRKKHLRLFPVKFCPISSSAGAAAAAKSLQSCLTLSDPMDCSPPGSSVHGIFQARVLEWVAIAFC